MTTGTATTGRQRLWRRLGAVAAVLALLLVFAAYLQPDMMLQMAQQIWSCF